MKRILYVDDNQDDHVVALHFFSEKNIDIACVKNTKEAFKELKREKYDLVVCDMMMPGEDGLFFAKKLTDENIEIPLILTSGMASLRGYKDYHGLKNYLGFILKPITPEKIDHILEKVEL